jgi:hypothetical protein
VLVETPTGSTELPAVEVVREPWSATFAVPLDALGDPDTTFALVPGRGPLIALPSPSLADARDDRFVRLGRTVNELRHRLTEAGAAADAAEQRRADAVSRRDRAVAELHDARRTIAELETRVAAAEQEAQTSAKDAADADAAAAHADEELATLRAQVDGLTARAETAERTAAESAEAAGLLGSLRGRIEDLEAERDRLVGVAEAARAEAARSERARLNAERRASAVAVAAVEDRGEDSRTRTTRSPWRPRPPLSRSTARCAGTTPRRRPTRRRARSSGPSTRSTSGMTSRTRTTRTTSRPATGGTSPRTAPPCTSCAPPSPRASRTSRR